MKKGRTFVSPTLNKVNGKQVVLAKRIIRTVLRSLKNWRKKWKASGTSNKHRTHCAKELEELEEKRSKSKERRDRTENNYY